MKATPISDSIQNMRRFSKMYSSIFGSNEEFLSRQQNRFISLIDSFHKSFGVTDDIFLFSAPGRAEISGNHTDHNHGRVLAAAINLDAIAVVSPASDRKVTLFSEGYDQPFEVELTKLRTISKRDFGKTSALIRGIASRMEQLGYTIGGFNAWIGSDVKIGSGLSSSAVIEVIIGAIFNTLFNNGKVAEETIAQIGQYAENVYFNKPCGLMDQLSCALGGIITIDFENPAIPLIQRIDFDFTRTGYHLLVVDTGGNHADLTSEYASIPDEMRAVANRLNAEVCRQITREQILSDMSELRASCGDRAVLRALHFISENERVLKQVKALEHDRFDEFLKLVTESGLSSFRWLQNCFSAQNPAEQGLTLALYMTEDFLRKIGAGACRVHGGGFAGAILAFLPDAHLESYIQAMQPICKPQDIRILEIRQTGVVCLNKFS
jgi:galactokinase